MADEYADAGRWRRDGLAYRITECIQRAALRRAHGVVMLTEAVRPYLSQAAAGRDAMFVIPCCANLERIEHRISEGNVARAEIGADILGESWYT